mgnify:CR=1 FL=1
MRIIGGSKKGTAIQPPKSMKLRPIKDNSKENIFNIIWNYFDFEDITVLDLFSGTGGISYEFASRGTEHILAVDNHPSSVKFIEKETERLGFDDKIEVLRMSAFDYLKATDEQFDIIFIDPPFALENKRSLIDLIFDNNLLKPQGMVIMEHFKKEDFEDHPNFREYRKYGKSVFSFFENKPEA